MTASKSAKRSLDRLAVPELPYTRFTLPNGLTVIHHEDRRLPTVTVQLWYKVGSKNEPYGRSGFAHLFEHLMFNGSEHFNDDWFKATQKLGATNLNGTTGLDFTNYYQTVPKGALDAILWLESDRMGYLLGTLDQAKLDEQRKVVQNEKRQNENRPMAAVPYRIMAGLLPPNHPYGHSTIGSMEDLRAASLDDVKRWFRDWYGPNNAVLVLAGDIGLDEAKDKAARYFGEIAPGRPTVQPSAWVEKLASDRREVMQDAVPAPRLFRAWNVPGSMTYDSDALDVIAFALAGDRNARLTR
ncbi:MAG: M16 family metallopeptidase, partial [Sphingopyxis sp.]